MGKISFTKPVGIAYIIIGFLLLFCGFTFELFDFFFLLITISLIVIGAVTAFMKSGVTIITYLSRIFVGSLFVVSGLIKTNDPLGFAYKLQEYFQADALGWTWFEGDSVSLYLAVFIAVAEVVLGLAILFGGKPKIASIGLLFMLVFFAWLTYFTASCNDSQMIALNNGDLFHRTCVTDCGCFGDALKDSVVGRSLSPWESFKKDMILLVFGLVIVLQNSKIKFNNIFDDILIIPLSALAIGLFAGGLFHWIFPLYFFIVAAMVYLLIKKIVKSENISSEWVTAFSMTLLVTAFALFCYDFLPVRDFRQFAVNKSFNLAVKGKSDKTELTWIYKVNGEIKEYSSNQKPWLINGAEYVDRKDVVLEEGFPSTLIEKKGALLNAKEEGFLYQNNIDGTFALFQPDSATDEWEKLNSDDINYLRDSISKEDIQFQYFFGEDPGYVFLFCSYDIKKADSTLNELVMDLSLSAQQEGHAFVGLTSNLTNIDNYRHKNNFAFDYYLVDEKVLKTMIRANPGLILVKSGIIVAKWNYNNLPSYIEIKNKYIN